MEAPDFVSERTERKGAVTKEKEKTKERNTEEERGKKGKIRKAGEGKTRGDMRRGEEEERRSGARREKRGGEGTERERERAPPMGVALVTEILFAKRITPGIYISPYRFCEYIRCLYLSR